MYSFKDKVYLVDGACNSCFYDFNKNQLFQCSIDYAELARKVVEGDCIELSYDEQDMLNTLLDAGIIIESAVKGNRGNINQLKKRKVDIDFAWIELTNQCNMQCIHCYDEACAANRQYLSLEDYKYVVDELENYGITAIQLIGGEPLMVKELKEMVQYTCSKMKSVAVFTNASMVTADLAQFFAKQHVKIAVSVYSYNEADHDYVTKVSGSHSLTMRGLKLLKQYGVHYRVANVRMNGINIGKPNTDLYSLNGGDIVRLSGRASGQLLNDELIKHKLITPKNLCKNLNEEYTSRAVSGHNCFSRRLYVASDMKVYPCVMERRLCHGSLRDKHLKEIIADDILSYNKDKISVCKDCEFRYACFDCRPNSITGEINEKPWYCTYNPNTGQWENVEDAVGRVYNQINT